MRTFPLVLIALAVCLSFAPRIGGEMDRAKQAWHASQKNVELGNGIVYEFLSNYWSDQK